MCLWERVERDHAIPVPQQRVDGVLLRPPVCLHEFITPPFAFGFRLRIRHRLQQLGRLWLDSPRQIIEDIGDLVVPAPLFRSCRVNFADGCPDPEMPIGHRQPREGESAVFEIAQDLQPTLLALPLATLTGQHNLLARAECAHDREECALAVLDTRLHVQAVGPPLDDLQIRQIPFRPRLVLKLEASLQPLQRACR